MTTAVAELDRLEASEREAAAERYAELLDKLEAGEAIDDKRALKVLRDAGKTTADVNAELARRKRVGELREQITSIGDLAARGRGLQDRLAAKQAEIEAVTKPLYEDLAAIKEEIKTLTPLSFQLEASQKELAKLCPLPADEAERRRLIGTSRAMLVRFEVQLQGRTDPAVSREQIARLEAQLAELQRERDQVGPLNVVNMFQVRSINSRIADCRRQLDEATQRLERDQPYVHQFNQLTALRARIAELAVAAPERA